MPENYFFYHNEEYLKRLSSDILNTFLEYPSSNAIKRKADQCLTFLTELTRLRREKNQIGYQKAYQKLIEAKKCFHTNDQLLDLWNELDNLLISPDLTSERKRIAKEILLNVRGYLDARNDKLYIAEAPYNAIICSKRKELMMLKGK